MTTILPAGFFAPEVKVLPVRVIGEDEWGRPMIISVRSGQIYVDISCGASDDTTNGLKGEWYWVTSDGEPCDTAGAEFRFEVAE